MRVKTEKGGGANISQEMSQVPAELKEKPDADDRGPEKEPAEVKQVAAEKKAEDIPDDVLQKAGDATGPSRVIQSVALGRVLTSQMFAKH